jgi:hypothetical protein
LAKVIRALRPDATFPGDHGATIHRRRRPACIIADPKWKDRQWIPPVAQHGWVAVSRDNDILDHLSLLQSIQEHGLWFVAITGDDGGNKWGQLEIVMTQWRQIEALTERSGPLLYTCTRTSFKAIDLQKRLDDVRREAAENPHYPPERAAPGATTGQRRTQDLQQEGLFDRRS